MKGLEGFPRIDYTQITQISISSDFTNFSHRSGKSKAIDLANYEVIENRNNFPDTNLHQPKSPQGIRFNGQITNIHCSFDDKRTTQFDRNTAPNLQ